MHENDVAKVIVDASCKIHKKLGPGLLESVYEIVLCHELQKQGLLVKRQVSIPVVWEDVVIQEGFRADLLVADKVIVEIKSVERLAQVHGKQLLTYLRLLDKRLGLLINFGEFLIKNGIKGSFVNNLGFRSSTSLRS